MQSIFWAGVAVQRDCGVLGKWHVETAMWVVVGIGEGGCTLKVVTK